MNESYWLGFLSTTLANVYLETGNTLAHDALIKLLASGDLAPSTADHIASKMNERGSDES